MLDDNTIAGAAENVALIGGGVSGAKVTHNRVGVDTAAEHTIGSPTDNIGLDGAPDATIEANIVAGAGTDVLVAGSLQTTGDVVDDGLRLTYHDPGDPLPAKPRSGTGDTISGNTVGLVAASAGTTSGEGIRVWEAAGATLNDNTVGFGQDGATPAPVTAGIFVASDSPDAVIGPNNAVGNATVAGIDLGGASSIVTGNKIGVPRFAAHAHAGNAIGIHADADASVHDNTVANSTTAGILVATSAVVTLRRNAVYATATTTGIAGAPAAPTLEGAAPSPVAAPCVRGWSSTVCRRRAAAPSRCSAT